MTSLGLVPLEISYKLIEVPRTSAPTFESPVQPSGTEPDNVIVNRYVQLDKNPAWVPLEKEIYH